MMREAGHLQGLHDVVSNLNGSPWNRVWRTAYDTNWKGFH